MDSHTVLVVDDSPTSRQVIAAILEQDVRLRIVGFAVNGREAIELANSLRPDVITMDINMPVMDGLEATREIMIEVPTPIVVISGTDRTKEVKTSMEALNAGALAVLRKPVGPHSPEYTALAKDIVRTVKAMADVLVIRHRRSRTLKLAPIDKSSEAKSSSPSSVDAIAILASTGGPPALSRLLRALPADFSVPILLVQHMVPSFVPGFATWLDSVIPLSVKLARNHEQIAAGNIYVGDAGSHLGIGGHGRIRLSDAPPIGGFQPAGTHLFESVASQFGAAGVGVVMTGMGNDGVVGLSKLHAAGATTIAQDEASSVVFGMAQVAVERNVISEVVPLEEIADRLVKLCQ